MLVVIGIVLLILILISVVLLITLNLNKHTSPPSTPPKDVKTVKVITKPDPNRLTLPPPDYNPLWSNPTIDSKPVSQQQQVVVNYPYIDELTTEPDTEEPVPLQTVLGEGQVIADGEKSLPQKSVKQTIKEPVSAPNPKKIGSPIDNTEPKELM